MWMLRTLAVGWLVFVTACGADSESSGKVGGAPDGSVSDGAVSKKDGSTVPRADGGTGDAGVECTAPVLSVGDGMLPHHIPDLCAKAENVTIRSGDWSDPEVWSLGHAPLDGETAAVSE